MHIPNILQTFLVKSGMNSFLGSFLKRKIFVYMYHSVTRDGDQTRHLYEHISIDAGKFESQIRFLKENGHTFWTFDDFGTAKMNESHKPTVVYFDDGYRDNLEIAMPILKKYGAKGTVFLPTNFIDGKSVLWSIRYKAYLEDRGVSKPEIHTKIEHLKTLSDNEAIRAVQSEVGDDPRYGSDLCKKIYMDWPEVRKLRESGWSVGSHTISHRRLDELSPDELLYELSESKKIISQNLGEEIISLSFPHGRFNQNVLDAAKKAGYKVVVSVGQSLNKPISLEECDGFMTIQNAPFYIRETLNQFQIRTYARNFFKR